MTNINHVDTLTIRRRTKEVDSLQISNSSGVILPLRDEFKLLSNIPLEMVDTSKVVFTDKDTLNVDYKVRLKKYSNDLLIDFIKKPDNNYRFQVMTKGIRDFL